MNMSHLFCLSGMGYLHDIIQRQERMIARVKAVLQANSGDLRKDEVWMDCEIDSEQYLLCLKHLLKLVRAGKSVMVTFKAEYQNFIEAFNGLTPCDPKNIVILNTKLYSLEDCYVNGEVVEVLNKTRLCAMA